MLSNDLILPQVTIVVIGYNEVDNLVKTMDAILAVDYPPELIEVIYVDSGSTDHSVEIAQRYTNRVFIEPKFPSPGRNRNRGLTEAKHEIVHFVDGDVEIDPYYLKSIVPLFLEKDVQAIVGQLDEQNPNIYNELSALSNVTKNEGYTHFTSTGATYLKEAILSVNGYDERIRRGEESELGDRFRDKGYRVWCTKYSMGKHNYGISSLWQYLRKYKTNALSLVSCAKISGDGQFFLMSRKRYRSQLIKIFFLFLSVVIAMFF